MALAPAVERAWREGRTVPLNPLHCSGTALPPPVLLAAKLIFLGLALKGYVNRIPGIFLPMWSWMDRVPHPDVVQPILQGAVLLSGTLLLCNRAVRASSLIIGAGFLLSILASRGFYSNGQLFCASMLLLIGLYSGVRGIWPIRWQVVLLYLGSGINKLMMPDWRSGWYFENLMHGILEHDGYQIVAAALPALALSRFFCWATIVIELSIAVSLAVPRFYRIGIWLALFFHFSSVAMTGMMFGIFVIAVTFSLLAFVEWPRAREIEILAAPGNSFVRWLLGVARRLDFDRVSRLAEESPGSGDLPRGSLRVRWKDRTHAGVGAVRRIALSLPAAYFAALLIMVLPSLYLRSIGR